MTVQDSIPVTIAGSFIMQMNFNAEKGVTQRYAEILCVALRNSFLRVKKLVPISTPKQQQNTAAI